MSSTNRPEETYENENGRTVWAPPEEFPRQCEQSTCQKWLKNAWAHRQHVSRAHDTQFARREAECEVCGEAFTVPQYQQEQRTCGAECGGVIGAEANRGVPRTSSTDGE